MAVHQKFHVITFFYVKLSGNVWHLHCFGSQTSEKKTEKKNHMNITDFAHLSKKTFSYFIEFYASNLYRYVTMYIERAASFYDLLMVCASRWWYVDDGAMNALHNTATHNSILINDYLIDYNDFITPVFPFQKVFFIILFLLLLYYIYYYDFVLYFLFFGIF